MTRINAGIKAKELPNKLIIAELHEVTRIPRAIAKGRWSLEGQPKEFKLGTGHVKFFYDKNGYLLNRYKELYLEAVNRGFNVQDFSGAEL